MNRTSCVKCTCVCTYVYLYAKSDYAITESIYFLREGLLQCTCSLNILQVLELWLTYVQPWKYTDPLKPSSENKDSLEALPRKWCVYYCTACYMNQGVQGKCITNESTKAQNSRRNSYAGITPCIEQGATGCVLYCACA